MSRGGKVFGQPEELPQNIGGNVMKGNTIKEKRKGLIVNLAVYAGAFGIALVPFFMIDSLIVSEMVFTVLATVIIYIVSVCVSDTSLYDPYWSVAPPVMLVIAMIKGGSWHRNGILILFAVLVWSVRLTLNWAKTYKGLGHEDWRYANFRKKLKKVPFELLNFFGFMMMPTLVTFAGLIGTFYIIQDESEDIMIQLGLFVMLLGVVLEHFADKSLHVFIDNNPGSKLTCREGLWKYSRHPNYLGEMMFWTGIFISYLAMYSEEWQKGLGFLLIICVFVFASIPLMEAHNLERRTDYREYMEETSVLIPEPSKIKSTAR